MADLTPVPDRPMVARSLTVGIVILCVGLLANPPHRYLTASQIRRVERAHARTVARELRTQARTIRITIRRAR